MKSYLEAAEALTAAQRCVLTCHVNPDGDAIGSVLGLAHSLRASGIEVHTILPSPAPSNLTWMPGSEMLQTFHPDAHVPVINDVDTIVVLDLNTVKRLDGLGEAIVASKARIVNIDHHTHPQDFAHVQCVDTDSPATCAMLYRLISTSSTLTLPPDAAQCLYTGIMTDTGNFRFPRTDAWLHRAVADLIEHGADPVSAYELTFNQNSLERTRLLGAALASLQVHHNGRLCTMFVRASDLMSLHCSVDDTEGLVHHTLSLQGVTMGILFVETDDIVKCSFRSKGETYVRDLAARYGGGGHVYAAGARVKGRPFTDVTAEVIAAAAEVL